MSELNLFIRKLYYSSYPQQKHKMDPIQQPPFSTICVSTTQKASSTGQGYHPRILKGGKELRSFGTRSGGYRGVGERGRGRFWGKLTIFRSCTGPPCLLSWETLADSRVSLFE